MSVANLQPPRAQKQQPSVVDPIWPSVQGPKCIYDTCFFYSKHTECRGPDCQVPSVLSKGVQYFQ